MILVMRVEQLTGYYSTLAFQSIGVHASVRHVVFGDQAGLSTESPILHFLASGNGIISIESGC